MVLLVKKWPFPARTKYDVMASLDSRGIVRTFVVSHFKLCKIHFFMTLGTFDYQVSL